MHPHQANGTRDTCRLATIAPVARSSRFHRAANTQPLSLVVTTTMPANTANCHHANSSQPTQSPAKALASHTRQRTNLSSHDVLQPVASATNSGPKTCASRTSIRDPSDRVKPSRIALSLSVPRSPRFTTCAPPSRSESSSHQPPWQHGPGLNGTSGRSRPRPGLIHERWVWHGTPGSPSSSAPLRDPDPLSGVRYSRRLRRH